MKGALATLRAIGHSAGDSFEEMPNTFFSELTLSLYPKNKHRREWALSNLELFYNSRRDIINAIKQVRRNYG